MARHRANHVQLAYAADAVIADKALTAEAAAMYAEMGIKVHVLGAVRV